MFISVHAFSSMHRPSLRISPASPSIHPRSTPPGRLSTSALPLQRCQLPHSSLQYRFFGHRARSVSPPQPRVRAQPFPQPSDALTSEAIAPPNAVAAERTPLSSVGRWTSAVLQPIFGRHGRPLRVLLLVSVVLLLHSTVVDVFTGNGPSMLPTFALSGEVFLVEALSSHLLRLSHAPPDFPSPTTPLASPALSFSSLLLPVLRPLFSIQAGDVVLCSNPVKADHSIAKRVIALPGEAVRSRVEDASSLLVVPSGCVWLQGDCLEASRDSREYGPVPIALIRGKVVAKLWPLHAARRIEAYAEVQGLLTAHSARAARRGLPLCIVEHINHCFLSVH